MTGPRWSRAGHVGHVADLSVRTLLATKGAIPVAREGDRTVIVSDTGDLAWLHDDGTLAALPVDADVLEADEIHLTDLGVVGTSVDRETITISVQGWSSSAVTEVHEHAGRPWGREAYCVVTADQLTVLEPSPDGVHASSFRLDGSVASRLWSDDLDLTAELEVVAAYGDLVVARADDGVLGDRLRVLLRGSGRLVDIASDHGSSAWHAHDGVFVVQRALEGNVLIFVDRDGAVTREPFERAIGSVGGDRGHFFAAVFDGVAEVVVECVPSAGRVLTRPVSQTRGKKSVGRGTAAWLSRGTLDGLVLESVGSQWPLPVARPRASSVIHEVARHASGATGLRWSPTESRPAGVVVHLHGGPEAYETDELRMFGLAADAIEAGWEWRSLNYRGSRSGDGRVTTAAWRRWGDVVGEDLGWLLGDQHGDRPVVLVGWSFGAALALAAARSLRPHGLVIGGTMGRLAAHRAAAVDADPAHGEWFDRRFDVDGADGLHLDTRPPSAPLRTRVVSFHGRDDQHCPYELFAPVPRAWSPMVASWQHHDLTGGSHYPTSLVDAELVRTESGALLHALGAAR